MNKIAEKPQNTKIIPAKRCPFPVTLVNARWIPDVLAILLVIVLSHYAVTNVHWLKKFDDWMLNDQIWGQVPKNANIQVNHFSHKTTAPENLLLVDIGEWPAFGDTRLKSQSQKDVIAKKVVEIIRLTGHMDPDLRPRLIALDMAFHSLPSASIAHDFLDLMLERKEITIGVVIGPKGIIWPNNYFWNELRQRPKISNQIAAINLEKPIGEPVRRYRTLYRDPNLGGVSSLGYCVGENLVFRNSRPSTTEPTLRRVRYRYLLHDEDHFPKDSEDGWADVSGVYILTLDAVLQELVLTAGNGLGPIPVKGSVLLLGMVGSNSNMTDRHSVCAYGVRANELGRFPVSQPGLLVHANAAVSSRLDPPVSSISHCLFLLIAFIIISFLVICRRLIINFSNRFRTYWITIRITLYSCTGACYFVLAWIGGEWAIRHYNKEIPLGTLTCASFALVVIHPVSGWFWRHFILKGVTWISLKRLPEFVRQAAAGALATEDPHRRFNAMVDIFQTLASLMALRRLAIWTLSNADKKQFEKSRRIIQSYIVRPTIGKYRALLHDLAFQSDDPILAADKTGESDRAFNRLLDVRNRFRHRSSAAMAPLEWQIAGDQVMNDLFIILNRCGPLIGGSFKRQPHDNIEPILISPGDHGEISLFPWIRELECDIHNDREIFLYADGIFDDPQRVWLEGRTPGCTPRIDQELLQRSFFDVRRMIIEGDRAEK